MATSLDSTTASQSPRLSGVSYAEVLRQSPPRSQSLYSTAFDRDSFENADNRGEFLDTNKDDEDGSLFSDTTLPSILRFEPRSFKRQVSGASTISSVPSSYGDKSFQSASSGEHVDSDDEDSTSDEDNDKENLSFPKHYPEPTLLEECNDEDTGNTSSGLASTSPQLNQDSRMPLNDITAAFEELSMADSSADPENQEASEDSGRVSPVDASSELKASIPDSAELCWVSLTDPSAPETTRSTATNTYPIRRSVIENLPRLLEQYADLRAYQTRNALFWARARAYDARDRYVKETYNADGTRKVPRKAEEDQVNKEDNHGQGDKGESQENDEDTWYSPRTPSPQVSPIASPTCPSTPFSSPTSPSFPGQGPTSSVYINLRYPWSGPTANSGGYQ
ncbi:hypothetical protein VKT23_009831 [Stygiomarasmius scandens]|uniref:Uncharacterized protein n=1 Tax=Marasmiellus scandens TaxID=2682957 RepID=A0ABR1IQQ0_9AGAR